MNFVQRNLPDKFSLDEKNLNRIDLRNLIFREIVANLLIHREFSSFYEAKFLIFFLNYFISIHDVDKFVFEIDFEIDFEGITPQDNLQDKGMLYERLQKFVGVMNGEMTREEIIVALQINDRKYFRENYLIPALKKRWIMMTMPTKPTRRNQRYLRIKKI
jgi:hypothetical protein